MASMLEMEMICRCACGFGTSRAGAFERGIGNADAELLLIVAAAGAANAGMPDLLTVGDRTLKQKMLAILDQTTVRKWKEDVGLLRELIEALWHQLRHGGHVAVVRSSTACFGVAIVLHQTMEPGGSNL